MELTGDSLKAMIQCPDFEVVFRDTAFTTILCIKTTQEGDGLLFLCTGETMK